MLDQWVPKLRHRVHRDKEDIFCASLNTQFPILTHTWLIIPLVLSTNTNFIIILYVHHLGMEEVDHDSSGKVKTVSIVREKRDLTRRRKCKRKERERDSHIKTQTGREKMRNGQVKKEKGDRGRRW